MSRDSHRNYSLDDYFTVEEMSEIKHEFYQGEIFAMAGASLRHNEIAANLLTQFRTRLRDSDCGAYGSDLRIQTPGGLYTHPDVSVIFDPVQLVPERSDTAMNPVVLAEVLSEATEDYDRGEKFALYKTISAFRHYFLISQTETLVDYYDRDDEGEWRRKTIRDPNEIIDIRSIGISFPMHELYRRARL